MSPPRLRPVVLLLLTVMAVLAGCSGGDDLPDVAAAVEARGGYADPGASLTQGEVEAAARNARNAGGVLGVVALDREPAGGATRYAEDVLDLTTVDEVLVVTPQELGAASAVRESLDASLDAASAGFDLGGDAGLVGGYVEALYGVPAGEVLAGADAAASSPGETSLVLPILVAVVVGGGVLATVLYGRRRRRDTDARRLDAARDEVREDLVVMADRILELDDDPGLDGDTEASGRFAQASAIYREAVASVEVLTDLALLRELDEDVELARWQLETIEAELRGAAPPPRPAPPPAATIPPPPPDRPTAPVPPSSLPVERPRPTMQLPEWARDEVRTRQRGRRGGGLLGDVLGGVVGGMAAGGRSRGGWSGGGFGGGSSRTRSGGSSTRRSGSGGRSSGRAKGRGGRRK